MSYNVSIMSGDISVGKMTLNGNSSLKENAKQVAKELNRTTKKPESENPLLKSFNEDLTEAVRTRGQLGLQTDTFTHRDEEESKSLRRTMQDTGRQIAEKALGGHPLEGNIGSLHSKVGVTGISVSTGVKLGNAEIAMGVQCGWNGDVNAGASLHLPVGK